MIKATQNSFQNLTLDKLENMFSSKDAIYQKNSDSTMIQSSINGWTTCSWKEISYILICRFFFYICLPNVRWFLLLLLSLSYKQNVSGRLKIYRNALTKLFVPHLCNFCPWFISKWNAISSVTSPLLDLLFPFV